MAQFSGKHFRGAMRVRKGIKHHEAEVRNKNFQAGKAAALAELESRLGSKAAPEILATLEAAGVKFVVPEGGEEGFVS